jgi:hypothetical protein
VSKSRNGASEGLESRVKQFLGLSDKEAAYIELPALLRDEIPLRIAPPNQRGSGRLSRF